MILGVRSARTDVSFGAGTTCINHVVLHVSEPDLALQDKQADVVIMLVRLGVPAGIFLNLANETFTIRFS